MTHSELMKACGISGEACDAELRSNNVTERETKEARRMGVDVSLRVAKTGYYCPECKVGLTHEVRLSTINIGEAHGPLGDLLREVAPR